MAWMAAGWFSEVVLRKEQAVDDMLQLESSEIEYIVDRYRRCRLSFGPDGVYLDAVQYPDQAKAILARREELAGLVHQDGSGV